MTLWSYVVTLGMVALVFTWAGWMAHEIYGSVRDHGIYLSGFRNGVRASLREIGPAGELRPDEIKVEIV